VLGAASQDAVRAAFDAFPPAGGPDPYVTRPRVISTPFVERHNARAPEDPAAVGAELVEALRGGRAHELVPFAGQTAGLIDRVLTAREIVEGMVRDAKARLAAVSQAVAGVTSAA
jgi:enoyl-[acyl-carrier protein] reductase II